MQIKTIYQICTLEAMKSPRQYIHTRKQKKSLPKKASKKTTYISEIQKMSKNTPGPGKYIINPQDAKLNKIIYKKVDFKALMNIPKKTYVDDLIKQKKKIPSLGKYQIQHDHTQEIRHRYSIIGDKARQQAKQCRQTIFDYVNRDVLKVDCGSYTTLKPLGCPKKYQSYIPEQQQVDQDQKLKSKSQSLPRIPGPQSYNPIPSRFTTFDMISSKSSNYEKNAYKKNKDKKQSLLKQISPGPKYSLIAQWSPKNKEDIVRNLFKSTKNLMPKSVYH